MRRSPKYQEVSMLKAILINTHIQSWILIGWQVTNQPIKSHIGKSLVTNMDLSMCYFLLVHALGPLYYQVINCRVIEYTN